MREKSGQLVLDKVEEGATVYPRYFTVARRKEGRMRKSWKLSKKLVEAKKREWC